MIDFGKPWPLGLSRRNAVLFAFGFAGLLAALYLVDRPISVWAQGLPDPVRVFFRLATEGGRSDWMLIPALVGWLGAWLLSLLTHDTTRRALRELAALSGFIFVGVGLPSLVATLLKRIIGRGRPETWTVDVPLGFQSPNWTAYAYQSFPSGHATTAFSLATVIGLLWPRAFWPAVAFAATVAASRVVVGAHYPTDITAGAVLGVLGAYAVRQLFVARGWLFTRSAAGRVERRPLTALLALLVRQQPPGSA